MPSQSGEQLPPAELADHVILCGANALASRMAEELTARYGVTVTAIVPSAADRHATRMAAMPGVRVLEHAELTAEAFLAAGLPAARGLAILHQDDLGNFHAALRAQELSPDIRLVIAIFNAGLGDRIRSFFADCAVLSEAQMAAPSLVAAALGEPAPSHVRMASRTMYVARREDVGADQIICGLAAGSDADAPNLLPPDDRARRAGAGRRRRHAAQSAVPAAAAGGWPRRCAPCEGCSRRSSGIAFAALVGVLAAGFALLAAAAGFTPLTALYLTLLDAAGAAVTEPSLSSAEKGAQFLLTFDGMAFLPLVTAAVVSARLPAAAVQPPLSGQSSSRASAASAPGSSASCTISASMSSASTRADATGMAMAKLLGIRVVVGETHGGDAPRGRHRHLPGHRVGHRQRHREPGDRAQRRALAAGPRIVVRLYDDDLAERSSARSATRCRGQPRTWPPASRRSSTIRYCARSPSAGTCCCWPRWPRRAGRRRPAGRRRAPARQRCA